MAALIDTDRQNLWAEFMRNNRAILREAGTSDLSKQQIRNMINDLDDWLDSNKTQANNSIRQPERGIAASSVKFALLAAIATRRAIKGL